MKKDLKLIEYGKSLVKDAKRFNADTISVTGHWNEAIDGWCMEITLRKHVICEGKEENDNSITAQTQ